MRQRPPIVQAQDGGIPPDFVPWWQVMMREQFAPPAQPMQMELDNVVLGTLMHSPQVKVLVDAPIIRRTSIMEAQGKFDVRQFAETKFVNTSDPVGNKLTTGGANRFLDQNFYATGGVRRQLQSGAQLEASQKIGYQNNNSIYFYPNNQGTARLSLTLTQPLMNGRGKAYNTSMILLAEIDSSMSRDDLSRQLQNVLFEVHQTYWELYLQRAVLLQRRKLREQAVGIRDELLERRDVDVLGSQLVRAKAAVAGREAAIIRFQTSVLNAESKLRALVNDPALRAGSALELVPVQCPSYALLPVDLHDSLVSALEHRPEVNEAAKEVRAACVRVNMAKNELLPVLNMVLGTYVYGLAGDAAIGQAYGDMFSVGRPTYSGGFTFEVPYGNHAARARLKQRMVETRQMANQLQVVMNRIRAEIEIAVREVDTTHREMVSKYYAMQADQAEIDYLAERWRLLPGDQQVAGVMLDDLLAAQQRLADAEYGFANSVVAYNMAIIGLKKATGTLLDYQEVAELEMRQDEQPLVAPPPVNPGMDSVVVPGEAVATPPGSPTPGPTLAPAQAMQRLPTVR